MQAIVSLYSTIPNEIEKFLTNFYNKPTSLINTSHPKEWQKNYQNPIEIADIIGAYIENIDTYNITMWISIDAHVFIKVTPENANELIRYLFERFPY